jgi:hypothetical protein
MGRWMKDVRLKEQYERTMRKEILSAAIRAVGDRGHKYGKPEESFSAIAVLWNGWIRLGNLENWRDWTLP